MTYVSTPRSGALPRRRVFKPGSFGAIALVIGIGAAIAGGIAVSSDETQPAAVSTSADTFTKQREGGASVQSTNSADQAHLNRGTDLARQGVLVPTGPGQPG